MDVRVGLWRKLSAEIDAFELWCWRRLLRVPWTARRSNQSILKVISPGISLEGIMLKLKLHYFGHLMQRFDSLEKTLMLGGIGYRRRRGRQRMIWLDGITDSMDMSLVNSGSWWWTGRPGMLWFMGSQRIRHDWLTDLIWFCRKCTNNFAFIHLFNYHNTFLSYRLLNIHLQMMALFYDIKKFSFFIKKKRKSSSWTFKVIPSLHYRFVFTIMPICGHDKYFKIIYKCGKYKHLLCHFIP